ncbi:unnamed protein product [Cyclocybe aegerita]|uniref:Uncharacterized protein n=1 Tax=Cyclocybe aegerita TaxID=1973307 RepID=A0A8S0VZT4_CYCAE|nr:unnamed protein product [Cyclocybe aegerita]
MFKVADTFRWLVVIHDPELIEELRKLPDSIVSTKEAIREGIQMKYTLGDHILNNPYHKPIIATKLRWALPELIPGAHEEVTDTFNELIQPTEGRYWTSVKVLNTMMKIIAHAGNRVLVGYPLCRDPDWVDLNVHYTLDVVKAGITL